MELYLQFAYGMKQIAIDLSKDWNGAKVILSPRDMSPQQLSNWTNVFTKAGLQTLFDPQCYYPKSNNKGLLKYDYWDTGFSTKLQGNETFEEGLLKSILYYNNIANTNEFIIPASMLEYDSTWYSRWVRACSKLIDASKKVVDRKKCLLTLALPSTLLLQKEDEIEKVISAVEKFDVEGLYIIAQPPQEKYLVDTPLWLINLIQLCAGLKLQNKKVVMGYGNHQLLCLTASGIDGMASGTYLNVRRFTNKFVENDSIQRKSVWYYYPAALSEYKMGYLDTAYNNGVLNIMKPSREMDNGYADILFSGAMPSTTSFNETMAFKHYLNCIRIQMRNLSKPTYEETFASNEFMLQNALRRIEHMEKNGVYAQARSFKDIVDVNLSALQRLNKNWGFQLKNEWDNINS